MRYDVRLENAQAGHAAVARALCAATELSKRVPALCGHVWNFIQKHRVPTDGHMLAIYRNADGAAFHVEGGARVKAPFAGGDGVACVEIPGGPVAMTEHVGPYSKLGAAHDAVHAWCAANGKQRTGVSWEIYDHPTPEESNLRTWVYHQVQ
jgi:effector-binding domain-containing protein